MALMPLIERVYVVFHRDRQEIYYLSPTRLYVFLRRFQFFEVLVQIQNQKTIIYGYRFDTWPQLLRH